MSQSQKNISPRAWGELLLLGVIWGAIFLSVRVALNEVGPLTVVLHRVFWAAILLWLVVLVRRLPLPKGLRVWGAFLVMGLLNNVIPFSLLAWGQLTIESGLTSIFNATTAIFGVIVAAFFFADERLGARKLLGVALGFAGVVTAIGVENLLRFDLRALAQWAVLAATLSYAFAGAWARVTLSDLPPLVAAAGMLTGSSVLILPLVFWFEAPLTFALSTPTWAALAYSSTIGTAFAYLLYYRVLAMAGSGNLLLVTLIIPPVAIVLGAGWLGETLPAQAYAGFVLLALGLLVLDGRIFAALHR